MPARRQTGAGISLFWQRHLREPGWMTAKAAGTATAASSVNLEIPLTLEPMEAQPVDDLPQGRCWLFEPKYDGFRCLLFRDGDEVHLQSRRQRPLGRYFPEVIEAARL